MAPIRGRRGRRSAREANLMRWEFLRPWVDALRSGMLPSAPGPVAPPTVEATVHCWSMVVSGQVERLRDCEICVQFPADIASRRDTQRLQRLREAIELFNALAPVDSAAFLGLLSEFIVGFENFRAAMNGVRVQPVWTLQLMGKLSREDYASKHSPITWDVLFGCPNDPWEYSEDFRAAAMKLEAMDTSSFERGLMYSIKWKTMQGIPLTAWREEPNDAWGDSMPINSWEEQPGDMYDDRRPHPMKDTMTRPTEEHFVREMKKRWKDTVPVIAQVAAVRYGMDVFTAWARSGQPQGNLTHITTRQTHFETREVMEAAIVWAHNGATNLTLTLDDRTVGRDQWDSAACSMGFFFSTVIAGKAMACSPLMRQMSYPFVKLIYSWTSNFTLTAMMSALTESHKVEIVSFQPDEADEHDIQPVNHERWKWLAFSLFSNASNSSVVKLDVSKFRLTKQDVSAVAAVMKSGYPQPTLQDSAQYGYVDVQKGTQVELALPYGNHYSIKLSHDIRCRALYEPNTAKNAVNIVVPGYGICRMSLGENNHNQFVPDPPSGPPIRANRDQSVECLDTFFLRPTSGKILTDMLALIGRNLNGLLIAETPDVRISVDLGDVADACPRLEMLRLTYFDVTFSNRETLCGWGIKDLVLMMSTEVPELVECLDDSRMFQQLQKLQVVVPQYVNLSPGYVRALEAHDKASIAVVKKKLPLPSKAALLSVVTRKTGGKRLDGDQEKGIGGISKRALGLIFEMAATPERRSVRITTFGL